MIKSVGLLTSFNLNEKVVFCLVVFCLYSHVMEFHFGDVGGGAL